MERILSAARANPVRQIPEHFALLHYKPEINLFVFLAPHLVDSG